MSAGFERAYPPAQPTGTAARWLIFTNNDLLVTGAHENVSLLESIEHMPEGTADTAIFLGRSDEIEYMASSLGADAELPDGVQPLGLRALFGKLSEEEYSIAGYASQMLLWQRSSRFCPVCSSPTEPVGGDWGRRCTVCGFTRYPQISPAILALVHDNDRVLLTHKPGWGPMFSIIAGFVEPNESLEACVRREVEEECGLSLEKLEYFGSQGWPFPAQLMIGFVCQYSSGEITIDDKELDDARWFHVADLPPLPGPLSLSRQLLDHWITSRERQNEVAERQGEG